MNRTPSIRTLAAAALLALALSPATGAAVEKRTGDFARGARAWADHCQRCHNVRDPKELRDDQWKTTVNHMRIRGGLTAQEVEDILIFLQTSNQP